MLADLVAAVAALGRTNEAARQAQLLCYRAPQIPLRAQRQKATAGNGHAGASEYPQWSAAVWAS